MALIYVRERIRTLDTLVRSQVLYPAELHAHIQFCIVPGDNAYYNSFRKKVNHFGTLFPNYNEWTFRDSNPGPIGYEPTALTS